MWIKICGNTTFEDAQFAAESGADAVGFIFAESPRRVSAEQAGEIIAQLPTQIEKLGVFVDAGFDEIVDTVTKTGLTGMQLHSTEDPNLPKRLRAHFDGTQGRGRLRILRVLHFGTELGPQLEAMSRDRAMDAVLIDSRTATQVGGTGIAYDWLRAQDSFLQSAPHLRLIAAGGLKPENVAEAIRTLQPWGVDVASGVEASPGRKDRARVRAFIELARTAAGAFRKQAAPDVVP